MRQRPDRPPSPDSRGKIRTYFTYALVLIAAGMWWACDSGDSEPGIPETPTQNPGLTTADVQLLMTHAVGEALRLNVDATVAVTDREGNVLGAFRMNGSAGTLEDAAFGAIAKARTAAYLSSNQHGFTTLTACFITRKHFPPGIANTPAGPLFGVPFSSLGGGDVQPNGGPPVPVAGQPGLTGVPGGVPVFKGGLLAGGLGVSGGSFDFELELCSGTSQDEMIALAAVRDYEVPADKRGDTILLDGIRLLFANATPPAPPVATPAYADLSTFGEVVPGFPLRDAPAPRFPGEGEVNLDPAHDFRFRAGTFLSVTDVERIILQAADQANRTRAAIRRPIGTPARVFISVVDVDGSILGIWRTRDATLFSYDVSAQKARTSLAFSDPSQPLGRRIRQILGLAADSDLAVSTRAVGFLSQDFFPPGIDRDTLGNPVVPGPLFEGPEFQLQAGLGLAPFGNGITIFPGGLPLYRNGELIGAVGISGDGVDQDDLICAAGAAGLEAPEDIRSDQFFFDGVRLPYVKFPRSPEVEQ